MSIRTLRRVIRDETARDGALSLFYVHLWTKKARATRWRKQ